MVNFETAVFDWLKKCSHFGALYLTRGDFAHEEIDNQAVMRTASLSESDEWVEKEMRGGTKQYSIGIQCFTTTSGVPFVDYNAKQKENVQKIQEWAKEQNKNKNFPSVGYEVEKISVTNQNVVELDQKNGTCVIQFFVKFDYNVNGMEE